MDNHGTIQSAAQQIMLGASNHYWMTASGGRDNYLGENERQVHREFQKLADALGYDITKRAAPAVQAAE